MFIGKEKLENCAYQLRRLKISERSQARKLCDQFPERSAFVRAALDKWRFYRDEPVILALFAPDSTMLGLASFDVSISLFGFTEPGIKLLAQYAEKRKMTATSIVGEAANVLAFWDQIEKFSLPAREIRKCQWVMRFMPQGAAAQVDPAQKESTCGAAEKILAAAQLRLAQPADFQLVFPAAVAMFIEELGYDPRKYGKSYADQVRRAICEKRIFIRTEKDYAGSERVIFKADVGILTGRVAQIQGVWTIPEMRGNGIASAAMSAVAKYLRDVYAAKVCLYVNDFNHSAVRAYEHAGFEICDTFATVMC